MEWISVKDKLPDSEDVYLCLFIGWDDMEFMRTLDYCPEDKDWTDTECIPYTTVTHWMPLPEPPKD